MPFIGSIFMCLSWSNGSSAIEPPATQLLPATQLSPQHVGVDFCPSNKRTYMLHNAYRFAQHCRVRGALLGPVEPGSAAGGDPLHPTPCALAPAWNLVSAYPKADADDGHHPLSRRRTTCPAARRTAASVPPWRKRPTTPARLSGTNARTRSPTSATGPMWCTVSYWHRRVRRIGRGTAPACGTWSTPPRSGGTPAWPKPSTRQSRATFRATNWVALLHAFVAPYVAQGMVADVAIHDDRHRA